MTEGRLEPASPDFVREHIKQQWGFPVVTLYRTYSPEDAATLEGLVYRDPSRKEGEIKGVIT